MARISSTLIALCLLCPAAAAEEVGGVELNLPSPAGYCQLDKAHAGDAALLRAVGEVIGRGPTRLLTMSAKCQQLEDWRAAKRELLANFAQYQTHKALENSKRPVPAEVIKRTCQAARSQNNDVADRILPEAQKNYDAVLKTIKLNEVKLLGVLDEDASACYMALLVRLRAENGADVTQVAVAATTIVKSKMIFYYLYAPYAGARAVTDQLAQVRRHLAVLHAANR